MRNKYIIFGIVMAAMFVLATHSGHGPMLGSIDIAIFRAINNDMQSPALNIVAAIAFDIGSSEMNIFIFMLSLISIILFVSMIRNNPEQKKLIFILLIALFISALIVNPLKSIFGISRPYAYLGDVHTYSNGRWLNSDEISLYGDGRDSFPSGHATILFTFLGVFWMYRRFRIPLLILLFMIMFLIVYVGQHYVSDIIAGGITGFVIGFSVRGISARAEPKDTSGDG